MRRNDLPVQTAPQVEQRGEAEGLGGGEDDVPGVAVGFGRPLAEVEELLLEGLRVHVLGGRVLGREGVDGGEEGDELWGHAEGAADHGLGLGGGQGVEPGGGVEGLGEGRVLQRVCGLAGAGEGELGAHEEGGLGGVIDELGGDDVEDVGVDGPAEAGVVRVVHHAVVHE